MEILDADVVRTINIIIILRWKNKQKPSGNQKSWANNSAATGRINNKQKKPGY